MSFQQSNATLISATASAQTQSATIDCTQLDRVSLQAIYTEATTAAKTFGGVREVDTVTFLALASCGDGDYFVLTDYLGAKWAVALDTTGGAANTPTGAAWVAVAAANKVYYNISAATSADDVSAAVNTALGTLTGFSDVITAVTATDHQTCTAAWAGVCTAPARYSKTGAAGTGSIVVAATTPGTSSAVNTTANTATITAHGQSTGSKVAATTAGALPTGLTPTNYWLIVVDANTVKFASTLANAVAGTAIDLTTPGYGTQTLTPAALSQVMKVQVSNDSVSPTNWTDIPGTTVTISATGATYWSSSTVYATGGVSNPQLDCAAKWLRVLLTPTGGQVTLTVTANTSSLTRN